MESDPLDTELARLIRTLVDAADVPVLLVRTEDDVVVDANEAWCALIESSRHATVGASARSAMPWSSRGEGDVPDETLNANVLVRVLDLRLRRARGGEGSSQVTVTITPLRLGGIPHRLLVVRDAPGRADVDWVGGQGRRLEDLGRLAAAVAHDFNNLLTVIRSYAGLMLEQVRGGGVMAPEDAQEIQRAATRGSELTRRLLAFTRNQVIEPQRVQLAAAVRSLHGILAPLVGDRVALDYRLDDDLPPILIDPVQLDQVLLNLVVNAAAAMPEGGLLVIAARRHHQSFPSVRARYGEGSVPDDPVVLEVIDTGRGMDEATLAKAFEPFFTTKSGEGGTGLGLPVVAGIVRQFGGALRVSSVPGTGTSIGILWPAAPEEERRALDEDTPATGMPCVLLVEDDRPVRQLLRRVILSGGFQVVAAPDGLAARERFESEWPPGVGPSVVLADVATPREDGWTLARWLSTERPHLPVLLMSALDWSVADVDLPENVRWPVLQKPFEAAELLDALRSVLDDMAFDATEE